MKRRGRMCLVALAAVASATFFVAAPAALADNGNGQPACGTSLTGQPQDPTAQGYCPPIAPPTTCPAGTTATTGGNGTVTCVPPTTCPAGTTATTGTNGAVTCSPPTTPPAAPPATPPTTPPTTCPAGTTATTMANGTVVCSTPPAPRTAPTSGVAGAHHTQTTKPAKTTPSKPASGVKGARHTVTSPSAGVAPAKASIAPITSVRRSGTLPFTGLQLTLFALAGIGLLGLGVLLRATTRKGSR